MSYDLHLINEETGEPYGLLEPLKEEDSGGTYQVRGNTETSLNITYNYGWFYYHFLDKEKGIRWLYGKKAKDCVERLEAVIEPFKDHQKYKDYWADTAGNCVAPLKTLLEWCKQFPKGVFKGD